MDLVRAECGDHVPEGRQALLKHRNITGLARNITGVDQNITLFDRYMIGLDYASEGAIIPG